MPSSLQHVIIFDRLGRIVDTIKAYCLEVANNTLPEGTNQEQYLRDHLTPEEYEFWMHLHFHPSTTHDKYSE